MRALTPKNFHIWIKDIQGLAGKNKVWAYVDPEGTRPEPEDPEYPDISRYLVTVPASDESVLEELPPANPPTANPPTATQTRPAMYADELTDKQRSAYQLDMSAFQLRQQQSEKVAAGIRVIDQAIKSSARIYIPDDMRTATVRDTLRLLEKRYKRTQKQIIEQLHLQFLFLRNPPAKDKIEQWVADWENLRVQIVNNEAVGLFGSETIFIDEFLRASRKWAPTFCDNWVQQKEAANLEPEFYDTTRRYRLAVEKSFNQKNALSFKLSANAAT